MGSPVIRYATSRLSTVSGRRMLRASIGVFGAALARELMNQSRPAFFADGTSVKKLTIYSLEAQSAL